MKQLNDKRDLTKGFFDFLVLIWFFLIMAKISVLDSSGSVGELSDIFHVSKKQLLSRMSWFLVLNGIIFEINFTQTFFRKNYFGNRKLPICLMAWNFAFSKKSVLFNVNSHKSDFLGFLIFEISMQIGNFPCPPLPSQNRAFFSLQTMCALFLFFKRFCIDFARNNF